MLNNQRKVTCCSLAKLKSDYNLFSGENKKGKIQRYCEDVTCMNEPCVDYRVWKRIEKYRYAFYGSSDIYFDRFFCDVGDVAKELKRLFKKVLVFDCFGACEAYFSEPVKGVDASEFHRVGEYEKELYDSVYKHQVINDKKYHGDGNGNGKRKRVRHKGILIPEEKRKMPTIDGFFAKDAGHAKSEEAIRVKFLLPEFTKFRLMDMKTGAEKILTYPEAVSNPEFKQQLRDFYFFTDEEFDKYI